MNIYSTYVHMYKLEAHFVHLSIGAVGLQHLRCHVVERPTPRVLQYARAVVLQLGGDAEVDQLQVWPDHEEVGWLQITVDNVVVMNGLQRIAV